MSGTGNSAFVALRLAVAVFAAGLAMAGLLVGFTYWYWENEKKNDRQSERTLGEMRTRLAAAQRERDDLRNSSDTYKALLAHGVFIAERRLDFVEAMQALKQRHQLLVLEYEMSPQRSLRLAGDITTPAIATRASRVAMRVRALHDGDLIAFLDEFPRLRRGLFPMDRCTIKRPAAVEMPSGGRPAGGEMETAAVPTTGIEAQCTFEWITLMDKGESTPAR